jgi:hypothetical protein
MRHRIAIYSSLLAAIVAGVLWAAVYSPAAVQRRGIHAAELLQSQFAPRIAKDRRFSQITLSVSTRPALLIMGCVSDEQALNDLHVLCPSTAPDAGFDVSWNVFVLPEAVLR